MMALGQLEAHEFANLFPMMPDSDLEKLTESIKSNGLRDPIITLDGQILDGRNRYKACVAAGVTPSTRRFEGDDPLSFVVDHNLRRRHLTESQRAMVAAKLSDLRQGGDRRSGSFKGPIGPLKKKKDEAAAELNVGRTSVTRAKRVQSEGSESLVKSVESGEVSVTCADEIRKLPKEEQDKVVDRGAEAIKYKAKEIRESAKPVATPAPVKTNPRNKITQDIGNQTATTAILILDKILKDDESREAGLQKVITYCEKRIKENR